MEYRNKVIVFPVGMKMPSDNLKTVTIKNSNIKVRSRKKTLKIGNAIRVRRLEESTTFDNCNIFFEGTLTQKGIIPWQITKCLIYVNSNEQIGTINGNNFYTR